MNMEDKLLDFTQVCEAPGALATDETLSMMLTRYHFAAAHARGRETLELACGAGCGLGYIARMARRVTGGDVDPKNLAPALERYRDNKRVDVRQVDALDCPFDDDSFGAVVLLDSIYWLSSAPRFFAEASRLLQPKGVLVISTVNPDWHGFNPSPRAVRYYNIPELAYGLREAGFNPSFHTGFRDRPEGIRGRCVAGVRWVAVKTGLIPTSVVAKEKLKRIFYGSLKKFPDEITDDIAPLENLQSVADDYRGTGEKIIYTAAVL
ncbi:MAG: class I SAM-dependent methyltransferase [Verrucomicrobiota bacterium]|jgi:SAM-dependent methyltransferase|nr:class I SAM-dependent methyltransferase [Verrucomicrobiota bacterium]